MTAARRVLVAIAALACACAHPAERESRAATSRDTLYRRLCADADSPVAGRGPCLLRDQSPRLARPPREP
jgi:hypothetical protein